MKMLTEALLEPLRNGEATISRMKTAPLSDVPFHADTESIARYFAENFPVHIAVHEVSPVHEPPVEYTQPHLHEDSNEINIIISPETLIYRIRISDDEYFVSSNSSIWIPRGTLHSANVLHGSGYFVTVRMK